MTVLPVLLAAVFFLIKFKWKSPLLVILDGFCRIRALFLLFEMASRGTRVCIAFLHDGGAVRGDDPGLGFGIVGAC